MRLQGTAVPLQDRHGRLIGYQGVRRRADDGIASAQLRRVSVDAIEHWMIYRQNPQIGAILHLHAWVAEIEATDVNYPCGTAELAESVASLVAAAPDPTHAVVGLRNHGITATGESLSEILDRIEPNLLRQVPMT